MRPKTINIIAAGLITYAVIILLCGCYTRQKATSQFSRAAVAYPELPADYCARTYPPHDSLIKGKDSLVIDTVIINGVIVKTDTVKFKDTVRITKTVTLPAQVITKTITRVDTIEKESTGLKAKLDLCDIEKNKAINLASDSVKEIARLKAARNKWRLIAIGLMASIALGIVALIRRKSR